MAGKRAIILGGTGQIGRAVAAHLLELGWQVRITHRGHSEMPPTLMERGVEALVHDRNSQRLSDALFAGGADLLLDTIAFDAPHGRQLLEIAPDVGQMVVVSSASVYCDAERRSLDEAGENGFPDVPHAMTEAQSVLPAGPENYSTQKVALEEVLLEGAKSPVAILRPCAIHGVGSVHPREWWLIKRMLDGRTAIPLAFAGQSRFHTSSVANIAAVVGILAEKPGTNVLNVGDRECLTLGQLARVLAEAVGYIGEFFEGDWGYPPVVGSTPWSVPAPFTIDSGAAMAVGYQPLGYAQTCLPVVEWLKAAHEQSGGKNPFPFFDRYPRDPFDYATEDAFFARVGTRALA